MKTGGNQIVLQQELVNTISHGAGVLFGVIALPYLILNAFKKLATAGVLAVCVYSFGFLMVFIFSTLYHSCKVPKTKRIFKIFDHISIYFLIAGTYTPFIIIFVNNRFGISLLIAVWALTFLGIFFKLFYTGKFEILSTIIYVMMGMLLLVGGKTFFAAMPVSIIELIITGGVLYFVGVLFYVWKKYKYNHGVWHLFVLSAAICHFAAILQAINF